MKDIKSVSNEKDVIIKGNATVNGGLLVGSVWKTITRNVRNVVFSIASVLKRIMLLTDKNTMFCSEIYIYNYVFSIL